MKTLKITTADILQHVDDIVITRYARKQNISTNVTFRQFVKKTLAAWENNSTEQWGVWEILEDLADSLDCSVFSIAEKGERLCVNDKCRLTITTTHI